MALVCEYASRLFLNVAEYKYTPQPAFTKQIPKPYVMFRAQPTKNLAISDLHYINPFGYRGILPSENKGKNEKRIFVLGGSTVFNGEKPIPLLLQREFEKRKFYNVKVFNFGVTSSVANQDLIRVLLEISEFEPDLIIMYGGGNEIINGDPRPGYPHIFALYENNPLWSRNVSSYQFIPLILYGSHLARYLIPDYFKKNFIKTNLPRNKYTGKLKDDETLNNESIQIYFKALYKTSKLAKDLNSEFISFFQPMRDFYKKYSNNKDFDHYNYMKNKVLEESKTYRDKNFLFVDLSNIFSNHSNNVFTDMIHLHPYAREEVAEIIFQHITTQFSKKLLSPERSLANELDG